MKKIIYLLIILLIASCKSNTKLHTETYKGKPILVGLASKSELQKKPYKKWFEKNYNDYVYDQEILNKLKSKINKFDFVVLIGTWCPDSQKQTPVFFKILDNCNYTKNVPVYTLERKYKKNKIAKKYQIIRVPTIIVFKDNNEIGRIIEYPMKTIEEDLKNIIINKNYIHELNKK